MTREEQISTKSKLTHDKADTRRDFVWGTQMSEDNKKWTDYNKQADAFCYEWDMLRPVDEEKYDECPKDDRALIKKHINIIRPYAVKDKVVNPITGVDGGICPGIEVYNKSHPKHKASY